MSTRPRRSRYFVPLTHKPLSALANVRAALDQRHQLEDASVREFAVLRGVLTPKEIQLARPPAPRGLALDETGRDAAKRNAMQRRRRGHPSWVGSDEELAELLDERRRKRGAR